MNLNCWFSDFSPMTNWYNVWDDIIVDTEPPSGFMSIWGRNGYFDAGWAGGPYWDSETVTLYFTAADNYIVDTIVISNNKDFTTAETIDNQNTYAWHTSGATETKIVYVKYIDGAGNGYVCTDDITIDTTFPSIFWTSVYDADSTTYDLNPDVISDTMDYTNSPNVILDIDGADTLIESYYAFSNCDSMTWSETNWDPANWNWSSVVQGGPNKTTFDLSWGASAPPLVQGERKVTFELGDVANNATLTQDTIYLDWFNPSYCTMTINAGAEWTNTSVVEVSFGSQDENFIKWIVLSETDAFSPSYKTLQYYAPTVSETTLYTIETGQGTKTIWLYSMDAAGNGGPGASWTFDSIKLDTEPPSGSVAFMGIDYAFQAPFAGGTYWNSNDVTVSFSPVDNFQVDTIVISNYIDFSSEVNTIPNQPTYPWTTTPPGQGVRTVYVKYIDPCGNQSITLSDTITIDTEPPQDLAITVYDASGMFDPYNPALTSDTFTYTNQETVTVHATATDNISGVSGWASSNTETYDEIHNYWFGTNWVSGDNSMTFNLTYPGAETFPFGEGERRVYGGVVDNANNTNFTTGDTIIVDTEPPASCSAVINDGSEYTNNTLFKLNISATDNYAVGWALASETDVFNPAWYLGNYNAPVVDGDTHWLTIISGQGTKTIYVYFADRAGNGGPLYGPTVVSDTVILDTEPPNGTVNVNGSWYAEYCNSNNVNLTLNAWDNLSPVDTMVISNYVDFSDGITVPYNPNYNGWVTITGQGTRTVYVNFIERAGNNLTVYDTIVIDTEPPQNAGLAPYDPDGSIPPGSPVPLGISDTYIYTNTQVIGVELQVTDNFGIGGIWIEADAGAASQWYSPPFGNTVTFDLAAAYAQGTKNIQIWYYDYAANAVVTQVETIIVDFELPVVSQVIINTGDLYTRFSDVSVYYDGTDNFELGWVAILTSINTDPDVVVEYNDTNSVSDSHYPISFGPTEGETQIIVAFIDRAGNGPFSGPPSTAFNTDTIIIDKTAPYGSWLMLANGETFIGSSLTTVDFAGADTWWIDYVLLSNTSAFTFPAQLNPWSNSINMNDFGWTLDGVDTQSIYLRYYDGAGNTRTYTDSIIVDVSPPYNDQLVINTGALFTSTPNVFLTTISALDTQSGVETFVRSLDPDFATAETYAYIPGMIQPFYLGPEDETITVYAAFIDHVGNRSTTTDTINVDLTAPFNGSIIINSNAEFTNTSTVALDISALDSQSGLNLMVISNSPTFEAEVETRAYSEAPQAWILYPGEGLRIVYVKFIDNVGNVSGTWQDTINIDMVPPVGTVIINNGDTYTARNTVTLGLAATDGMSPIDTVVISNYPDFMPANTYTIPESSSLYNSTTIWILIPGDLVRTAYVKYFDRPGNSSTCTDSIEIDITPPVGTVLIDTGAVFTDTFTVALNLTVMDTQSGTYKIWVSNDSFVSSIETFPLSDGSSQMSWKLFMTDDTKTVWVQFYDNVDNFANFTDSIRVDITPPSGSVLINSGAEYSNTYTVVLNFSRIETQSGIKEIQVSNDEFWSSFETYTSIASVPWTLYGVADGVRTVWVKYIDEMDWASTVMTDTIVIDTYPPVGSMNINDNQLFANSNTVTLWLNATDNNKVYNVLVSNDSFATTASLPYASRVQWNAGAGDETKTVQVKFQDGAGWISGEYSDSIYLDLANPSGTVTINEGDLINSLNINLTLAASDTQTPVDTMVIGDGANTAVYAYAAALPWTFASDGSKTITASFLDRAGNSTQATDNVMVDLTPPSASVSIDEGTIYNGLTINLTLASADTQSVVDTMVIADGAAVNTYAYAPAQAWTFATGGNKTVTVVFIDRAGNISPAASDTILVDLNLPSGTVSINQGDLHNSLTVNLTLSASDTQTYVDTMVITDGSATSTEPYATSKTWTFASDGSKTITARFIDSTGNVSAGATDTTVIDITPPTAGVSINQGHLYYGHLIGLTLASADTQVTVDWMVISDGENVNTYAYATSKSWAFVSDGNKTVTVKFIDKAGNSSAAASDTTVIDVMPPFGTVSIDEGDIYSGGLTVNLTISADDTQVPVDTMVIYDGTATGTFAYATSHAWTFAKDGNKSVYARFIDRAGNKSDTASDAVLIDLTPPSGSVSFIEGTIFGSLSVNLAISAADTQLTVDTMVLTDGVTTSTEPYAISRAWVFGSDGSKTINAKFIDNAGNASGWFTDNIEIDLTPPSGSVVIDQKPIYASRTVSLSITAADTQTSVDTMVVSDGTATSTSAYSPTKAWTFVSDGNQTVNVSFIDHVGNVSSQFSDNITIDLTPPSGSVSIDEGILYNGLTVNLTLASADTQSAVTTMMIMDGVNGSTLPFAAAAPWTFASDGNKTVSVRFIDAAGNLSVWYSAATTIDLTPPSGTIGIDEGDLHGDMAVSLTISAYDTQVSVNSMIIGDGENTSVLAYAATQPWAFTSDGTKRVSVQFTDDAGNTSKQFADNIVIDMTPPSGTVSIDQKPLYNNRTVSTVISAVDTQCAIDSMVISDGTNTSTCAYAASKTWTFATDGNNTLSVRFIDHIGNVSGVFTDNILIDLTPPSGTVTIDEGKICNNLNVNLTIAAADTQSAITTMIISDGVTTNTYAFGPAVAWAIYSEGNKTVSVRFIDAAGNVSRSFSDTTFIDITPPSGTVAIDQGILHNSRTITMALSASDALVSVDTMVIDDGTNVNTMPYATAIGWTFDADGVNVINARFLDKAGNVSANASDSILIDITPPSGTVVIDEDLFLNKMSINLTLNAADTQVAVDAMVITDGVSTSTSAYATSKAWTFTYDGNRMIQVWFIDHAGNISAQATDNILIDVTNPSGSVSINEGVLFNSLTVNLTLNAADTESLVDTMVISDGVNTETSALAGAKVWTFVSDGVKTVTARFIDRPGNISPVYSDTILIDVTSPSGSVVIDTGANYTENWTVSIALSASDALTSVDTVVISEGGVDNTSAYTPGSRALVLSAGDDLKTVTVRYIDKVGNSVTATDTIVIDVAYPDGAFALNAGFDYVNSINVIVNIYAVDTQSGIAQVMLSNDNLNFVARAYDPAGIVWTLPNTGDGERYVYAKYFDALGHVSPVRSDTIVVDLTPPSGSVKINNGDQYVNTYTVTLNFSSVDTQAGNGQIAVSNDNFSTVNTIAYVTSANWVLSQNVLDGIKTVWVKFIDACGNISDAKSDTIMITGIAQVGVVTVPNTVPSSGNTWTMSLTVQNIGMKNVTIDTATSCVVFTMDGEDISSEFTVTKPNPLGLAPGNLGASTFTVTKTTNRTGRMTVDIFVGAKDDKGPALGVHLARTIDVFSPANEDRSYTLMNEFGDTIVELNIPAGSLTEPASIVIAFMTINDSICEANTWALINGQYAGISELNGRIVSIRAVRVSDTSTDVTLNNTSAVRITISYAGVWLGLENPSNLRVFVLNGRTWELVAGAVQVDLVNRTVTVTVSHFSVYRLMIFRPYQAGSDLSGVLVFPNPYIPAQAVGGTVKFNHLTKLATIRIYNSVGEFIKEVAVDDPNGEASWNGKNASGVDVAPGIYIYVITNPSGNRTTGKIGLIR
ncbi:hypothetical protein COY52_10920 [Candidatus Desantisbacteria bacterium CG_4_10_14_0_8_um_filter_48_22]|uniref:Ig-like domain-containing protein n=1 Tax=Candidatus Desantisbacteria bacterium CG_4_10_14_0_8_um_filter_48_22 TaxID=1974543 RepID=A0A2M7S5M3_9BACT|nr:MAG: hypothetical protein COY52_10920 [Candidatus Desantisbacteria bacterium CG_4_10_14_0_8_um_filter_48_22]